MPAAWAPTSSNLAVSYWAALSSLLLLHLLLLQLFLSGRIFVMETYASWACLWANILLPVLDVIYHVAWRSKTAYTMSLAFVRMEPGYNAWCGAVECLFHLSV